MPAFYNITRGRKKSKTSETTSGSAYGGFNLNNEADESEEDIQEKRAMGRDQANAKKKSCASSCEGSSLFVDLLADKFLNMKKKKWEKREEQQQSYIQLKNRELDIREAERREATESSYSGKKSLVDRQREKADVTGENGVDLLGAIKKKVGNGFIPRLWEGSLEKRRNARGGVEQLQLVSLQSLLQGLILPNTSDRWVWLISGDGEFSVSSVRNLIDEKTLGTVGN
ncbi:hypothetical protein Tco_1034938 [Tanacetum coccineum]